MAFKITYSNGDVKEFETLEELQNKFYTPPSWDFDKIKEFMLKFYQIKLIEEDSREQKIYARLAKVKRPKPKTVKFKVGSIIRLKDYSKYEYPAYKNQEAVILREAKDGFDWYIRWPDGNTSYAEEDNMIKVGEDGK